MINLSFINYSGKGVVLALIVILGGLFIGNNINLGTHVNFTFLNTPISDEGSGNLVIHEILIRDYFVNMKTTKYSFSIGLNWVPINESTIKHSCYFEQYSDEVIDYSSSDRISYNQNLRYKWDPAIITNTTHFPIVWIKAIDVQRGIFSLTYVDFMNWSYNEIIDHNSSIYDNYNWFWFGGNPQSMGEDFAGGLTLKMIFANDS